VSRPRRDYGVELSRDGTLVTDRGRTLDAPPGWMPEHLVLAALARCTVLALEFHARRASVSATATVAATGEIDQREDGSWGFVRLACTVDARLEPLPPAPELAGLMDRAEHGCFIGASLSPKPTYHWRVNGDELR
jgi:organic hydroperoxide reductase OsmC/OhrA